MVTTPDGGSEEQQPVEQPAVEIQDLGDADAVEQQEQQQVPEDGDQPQAAPEGTLDVGVEENASQQIPDLDPIPQQAGPQQQELEELYRMRQINAQKQWESQQIRAAQQIEQRALDQGADANTARQLGRQHIQNQSKLRDQENKSLDLLSFVEGRNNAAMHFMEKYDLLPKQAAKDLKDLIRTGRTPQEMDQQAKNMALLRKQQAEIARLKQGRVSAQTFDNSQGAPEVTSNQDQLLERYINGDRSEAVVKAAQRLAMGS